MLSLPLEYSLPMQFRQVIYSMNVEKEEALLIKLEMGV